MGIENKGTACFYCRHGGAQLGEHGKSSRFDCALGIDNSQMNGEIEQVLACPSGSPRFGFQMGGYYTHMWFEYDGTPPEQGGEPNGCLEWHIASDGGLPTKMAITGLQFHLCDFDQLQRFVTFWTKELERRGWIKSDAEDTDARVAQKLREYADQIESGEWNAEVSLSLEAIMEELSPENDARCFKPTGDRRVVLLLRKLH